MSGPSWEPGRSTEPRLCRMLSWGEVEVGDVLVIAAKMQTVEGIDDSNEGERRIDFDGGDWLWLARASPILCIHMSTDEREFILFGPNGEGVGGDQLGDHEELEVVPLARAVAAELKAGNLTQRIIEQGRVLTDCDERRIAAEQRARDAEEKLHGEDNEVEELATELADARREANEAEAEREALKVALARSGEALHGLSDDPIHRGHVFTDCPDYNCQAARAALTASVSKEEARDDA